MGVRRAGEHHHRASVPHHGAKPSGLRIERPEDHPMGTDRDPESLPDLSTWYLVTNLPAPTERLGSEPPFPPASLEEAMRLYGLRMWVEQSYKQVKHALGWSEYQVRSDQAMRRHWQLVCCAFCFCWYHQAHLPTAEPAAVPAPRAPAAQHDPEELQGSQRVEEKKGARNVRTTTDLAQSVTSGQSLVGTLGLAHTLLARVVRTAPTSPTPATS